MHVYMQKDVNMNFCLCEGGAQKQHTKLVTVFIFAIKKDWERGNFCFYFLRICIVLFFYFYFFTKSYFFRAQKKKYRKRSKFYLFIKVIFFPATTTWDGKCKADPAAVS